MKKVIFKYDEKTDKTTLYSITKRPFEIQIFKKKILEVEGEIEEKAIEVFSTTEPFTPYQVFTSKRKVWLFKQDILKEQFDDCSVSFFGLLVRDKQKMHSIEIEIPIGKNLFVLEDGYRIIDNNGISLKTKLLKLFDQKYANLTSTMETYDSYILNNDIYLLETEKISKEYVTRDKEKLLKDSKLNCLKYML